MDSKDLELAQRVGFLLLNQQQLLALAESCTGGGIAALITEIPGSAQWFERGFVTYSNLSKEQLLGVPAKMISQYGAVSEEVVSAMAIGAIKHSVAHWAVAVSGVAGPTGGSVEKPVGMVCIAWANNNGLCEVQTYHFEGNRQEVRAQTTRYALQGLITRLDH